MSEAGSWVHCASFLRAYSASALFVSVPRARRLIRRPPGGRRTINISPLRGFFWPRSLTARNYLRKSAFICGCFFVSLPVAPEAWRRRINWRPFAVGLCSPSAGNSPSVFLRPDGRRPAGVFLVHPDCCEGPLAELPPWFCHRF